jgi:hypothetical protein
MKFLFFVAGPHCIVFTCVFGLVEQVGCAEKKMLLHGYDHNLNGVDGLLSQIFISCAFIHVVRCCSHTDRNSVVY